MPQPYEHSPSFPPGVLITRVDGARQASQALINILITSRQNYDWPANTGAAISQLSVITLEQSVRGHLAALSPTTAHDIVVSVSGWAGNKGPAHANIVAASTAQKIAMQSAIMQLQNQDTASAGIDALSALPGINLVIASKVYRFCAPGIGAAVDRHSSYFFNSLALNDGGRSTHFRREWANGRHSASRLAIYNNAGYEINLNEYFSSYIPLLICIADQLNAAGHLYTCAETKAMREWSPADVEMAAYYWWACNGAR